jgi:hypothetical protein
MLGLLWVDRVCYSTPQTRRCSGSSAHHCRLSGAQLRDGDDNSRS